MSQNAREAILEEFAIEYPVTEPQLVPEGALAKEVCYARDLRTLGQVLEGYSVGKLEIEMGDGRYQVRGQKNRHPEEPIPLTKIIRQWFGANDSGIKTTKKRGVVNCQVSKRELDMADSINRGNRQTQGEMPDAYSLSQILRSVYLDTRDGALFHRLQIENERVTLEYVTANGKPKRVDETLKFFYDYWVQMYLRRSARWKPCSVDF